MTMPGLGPLLAAEVDRHPGLQRMGQPAFDGRADLVFFQSARGVDPTVALRTAEDVFVLLSYATSEADPQRLTSRLVQRERLERALSVWSRLVRPLASAMGYRVIVRVLSEENFRRTSLRSVVSAAVACHRPRWRVEDPADIELWISELSDSRFVAGVRLSDKSMRQRGGREIERQGALRPVVAAAMVALAGEPKGLLLDPCCGSGTIVGEALAVGWRGCGSDIDDDAVAIARRNHPACEFRQADARELPFADGEADALVSNLPFGKQFEVQGDRKAWLRSMLTEAARVTAPGGRIVVLVAPPLPDPRQQDLELVDGYEIRLLGTRSTIWVIGRP
jgi:SAM-dependent methyltransferase